MNHNLAEQVGVYRRSNTNLRYPLMSLGTEFGRLRVIENDLFVTLSGRQRRACRLRCTCGKEIVRSYCTLRQDRHTSCGCWKVERRKKLNLSRHPLISVGTMFGRWVVIETGLYRTLGTQRHRACCVRCQCGTEAVRTYGALRSGDSPSCGCKKKERSIERVWKDLHKNMANRGWEFHITLPQLKVISQLPCIYCGAEPSNVVRPKYKIDGKMLLVPSMEIRYSGIDRIDSMKGYVPGNVVPCCRDCNRMKSDFSLDNFLELVDRIQAHNSTAAGVHLMAATLFD